MSHQYLLFLPAKMTVKKKVTKDTVRCQIMKQIKDTHYYFLECKEYKLHLTT